VFSAFCALWEGLPLVPRSPWLGHSSVLLSQPSSVHNLVLYSFPPSNLAPFLLPMCGCNPLTAHFHPPSHFEYTFVFFAPRRVFDVVFYPASKQPTFFFFFCWSNEFFFRLAFLGLPCGTSVSFFFFLLAPPSVRVCTFLRFS